MYSKDTKAIKEAKAIAIRDLRSNYGNLGIYAGPKNFHEYWARDGFFATFGACSLKDYKIVRKNLDLFIKYQAVDGQIPLRVEEKKHALSLLGINLPYKQPQPVYNSSQIWAAKAMDPTILFVIAALFYVNSSGDNGWLSKNESNISKAIDWVLKRKGENGLIDEGLIANWADMALKAGSVTYTNVCFWKALKDFSEIRPEFNAEAESLKKAINSKLWSKGKGYYVDWVGRNGHIYDDFFVDGNLLAVVWGLADASKAQSIFSFIVKNRLDTPPVIPCFPRLPWLMDIVIRIVSPFFHTKNIFAWWGPWEILGKVAVDDESGAIKDLINLSEIVVGNGTFVEVFNQKGFPADVFWYKVERKAAWGAGVFLYAVSEFEKRGMI